MSNQIKSTFTGHPKTGATIKIFINYHPAAKRLKYSVDSRWESFKSFSTLKSAEAFFEGFATGAA